MILVHLARGFEEVGSCYGRRYCAGPEWTPILCADHDGKWSAPTPCI